MRKNYKRRQFMLALVDLLLLALSLYLALRIRSGESLRPTAYREHLIDFIPVFLFWLAVFYTAGLYSLDRAFDGISFAGRTIGASTIAVLLSALYFYLAPSLSISPKTVLALFAGIFVLLFLVWRFAYGRIARLVFPKVGVVFIGATEEAIALSAEIQRNPQLGYSVRFFFDERERHCAVADVPLVTDAVVLAGAIDTSEVDLVILSDERLIRDEVQRRLFELLERRIRFMRLPDFYELLLRRVPIGAISEAWFLENIDLREKQNYDRVKRVMDFIIALVGLLVSLPLWPIVAIGIKLSSPGPVFFRQRRLGKGSRAFTMIKFRTMRIAGNDFKPTEEKDDRIPPFGAFLRKSRIDEIPQVINVLLGEMSVIGPRPERPELVDELERAIPFYRQRLLVKPGLSGWDQVSGEYHSPSIADTYKKLQFDLYYVKNRSALLDVSILFKTIGTVISRSGR
jgi:exopolysaccharide biosynthesis polyprenyl glycosylphosphotransferase